MAHFPFTHADIVALAEKVNTGLTGNPDVYPTPTVDLADFAAKIDLFKQKDSAFVAANAAKKAATEERQTVLADLKTMMRKQLRYAENTVGFDDADLMLIGWSDKHPRVSEAPGQVLELKAVEQGIDFVVLNWKTPSDGGKPMAYEVRWRDGGEASQWKPAGTAITTSIKLIDRPRYTDLEYKVIAMNKAGEGQESNTVNVVL